MNKSRESETRQEAGLSDAALVEAARSGEVWAQAGLYRRYSRLVIGLSHRILAGRDEADDLAQDVFVYALSRLDTLKNPQAFAAWVSSIVVRTASKRLRKRRMLLRLGFLRSEAPDLDRLVAPSAPPDVMSELRSVYSMLERLPAEERIALVLRRVEGLELAEIASQMGISLATVKRRLSAANGRIERASAEK